jgi:hypothetical protein
MTVLGPGTLKIGSVGSEIDASCLVNNARLTSSKDQGDPKTMLCGTVKPGSVTYSFSLSGNVDVDPEEGEDGLLALSHLSKGTQQPFSFIPNTAEGTEVKGTLIIDPLDFGADDYGSDLDSDFEFALVGDPVWPWGGAVPATGATAGIPGTWTPSGATPPANAAAAAGITATPNTAWTTGQYVQGSTAGTAGEMYWDGSAWATGKAT